MKTTEKQWYLFDVNPATPPAFEVAPGEEFTLEVRGAFADVKDVRTVPTPFTPACDGHPLAPIAGPVKIRGAQPGDVIVVDLLEISPHGEGKTAILRDFGVLRKEFGEPWALACPVKDGKAWFGGRIGIPLNPNLGTVSTMPTEGYKPAYAGPYGGDFDQKDVRAGCRVHLPVMVPGALLFLILFRMEFGIVALIGIILLIGIVKKNAIMMIDFALEAEREQGKKAEEAIHQACLLRFRPIMMTTFAALFGGLPLALGTGTGAELRHPLGVTIVGGLLVSQLLTLYTTPVVYIWFDKLSARVRRRVRIGNTAPADGRAARLLPPRSLATLGMTTRS